jgi:hypothetical protein
MMIYGCPFLFRDRLRSSIIAAKNDAKKTATNGYSFFIPPLKIPPIINIPEQATLGFCGSNTEVPSAIRNEL